MELNCQFRPIVALKSGGAGSIALPIDGIVKVASGVAFRLPERMGEVDGPKPKTRFRLVVAGSKPKEYRPHSPACRKPGTGYSAPARPPPRPGPSACPGQPAGSCVASGRGHRSRTQAVFSFRSLRFSLYAVGFPDESGAPLKPNLKSKSKSAVPAVACRKFPDRNPPAHSDY